MIEIRTELSVVGPCVDFAALDDLTGVTGEARDVRRVFGLEGWHDEASWRIRASLRASASRPEKFGETWEYPSITVPTEAVLSQIADRSEAVGRYCRDLGLQVYLTEIIWASGHRLPIIEFPPQLLGYLAALSATLQFDIYIDDESTLDVWATC